MRDGSGGTLERRAASMDKPKVSVNFGLGGALKQSFVLQIRD